MPKIVIKEFDKTSAGIGLYSNFTVLVPGFVNEGLGYDEDKFDDNHVCEVSTKKDFENWIGKVPASLGLVQAAVAAEREPGLPIDFYQDYREDGSDEGSEDLTPKERLIAYLETELQPNMYLCEWEANTTGVVGYLKDSEKKYTNITLQIASEESYEVKETGYYLIRNDKVGSDAVYGTQYGNQIAYELIKLGYTVLFKKLDLISDLNKNEFWEPLKDKSMYDFRYVINGLLTGNKVANGKIRDLAHFINKDALTNLDNGRGDCTALCDIDASVYTQKSQADAILGIEEEIASFNTSKYAALFAPFVVYNMEDIGVYGNTTFPASFHYLACAAKAAENYNEWYAIAGYTRGISDFSIASVGCKFGEEAVNALEPRYNTWDAEKKTGVEKAVNIIVKIKGNYYLWGNRTAEKLGTEGSDDGDLKASHFLNIRQLCSTIKKQVYITCRKYTFDPNSDVLWINFCNAIRPLLEKMKADQGITDYKFIKVKAPKATLKALIRIVPIEAVEDFDISLTLEDSIGSAEAIIDESAE